MSHFLPLKLRIALARKGFTQGRYGLTANDYTISFLFCKELHTIPLEEVPLYLASHNTCMERLTCAGELDQATYENAIKPFLATRLDTGI